jgi:pectinesterase
MKNLRAIGHFGGLLVALVALGTGACGGGTPAAKPDTGVQDVAADQQQATDVPPGTDVAPDGGVDDAAVTDDAADGPVDAGSGIDCAPGPTGGPKPAGTAPQQAAGPTVATSATRPELSAGVADGQYTIQKALANGYLINGGTPPDGGVAPATFSETDNWDPQANGIGDPATFTPMFTVAADGSGTHTSLMAAFDAANALGVCGRVYIRLMPGSYTGPFVLNSKTSAPGITLYSTESDATKTVIVKDLAAATAGSMTNSATLTIKAVRGFQMKNLTVANSYVEGSATGNQSAVAMLVQSDKAQFENVRFIGNIGTLYVKSSSELIKARSYFRDCYIEGDQDFIVGRGTAVFDHCEIKYLASRTPTGGNIGYPSTLVFNDYGFLFDSCNFTAEVGAGGVTLGRQWAEESDTVAIRGTAVGKMIVRNSTLGAHLAGAAPWSLTGARTTTPKNPDVDAGQAPVLLYTSDDYFPAGAGPTPAEPYLGEYRNTGAGAHQ